MRTVTTLDDLTGLPGHWMLYKGGFEPMTVDEMRAVFTDGMDTLGLLPATVHAPVPDDAHGEVHTLARQIATGLDGPSEYADWSEDYRDEMDECALLAIAAGYRHIDPTNDKTVQTVHDAISAHQPVADRCTSPGCDFTGTTAEFQTHQARSILIALKEKR